MTTVQVVETSVTVNNNSPIQDYVHPDDQTQPFVKVKPSTHSSIPFSLRKQYYVSTQLSESKPKLNLS